LLHDIVVTVTN